MTEERRKSQLDSLEFESTKRNVALDIAGISGSNSEPRLTGSENVSHLEDTRPYMDIKESTSAPVEEDAKDSGAQDPRWRTKGESIDNGVSVTGQNPSFQDLFNQNSASAPSCDVEKVNSGRGEDLSDPLRSSQIATLPETDDMKVTLGGEALIPDNDEQHLPGDQKASSALVTKRTSHLHLNLKPPSPQPWDLVDPPARIESPHPQKFSIQQDAVNTRPLIPKSSYYYGPPPPESAFGTQPIGQIGLHHPREIIRVERDYSGGELTQFAPIFPLELESRLTPTQFLESINAINELLISAHSLRRSFVDNILAVFTLQLSRLVFTSHYDKEMKRLQDLIGSLNVEIYNPVGLNILWPRNVAFLFLEIEYY